MYKTMSAELKQWFDHNRDDLRATLVNSPIKAEVGKEKTLRRIVSDPSFIAQSWKVFLKRMEVLNTSAPLLEEVSALSSEIEKLLADASFPTEMRESIIEFGALYESAKDDQERLSAVIKGEVEQLIPRKLAEVTKKHLQRGISGEPIVAGFSFQACGFCGVVAGEFGPLGSLGACIICGVLL